MGMYWNDGHRALYNSSCREMELPDNSVQCVVTSPPYWGLRKYAGEQDSIWGGTPDCLHEWVSKDTKLPTQQTGDNGFKRPWRDEISTDLSFQIGYCSLCGAWRGGFGLEPTPEMYVQHTIEILREIRRVLRKDGVCFWNIGDSYNGSGGAGGDYSKGGLREGQPKYKGRNALSLKPKDLCLIPFRVAIAAQDDGWWVRSIIIWAKPNPMPESVTDRPTESHEYILMLTKSAKYYWDMDAVREPNISPNLAGRNLRSVWTFPTQPYRGAHFATFPEKLPELCIKAATPEAGCCPKCGKPYDRIMGDKQVIDRDRPNGFSAGELKSGRCGTTSTLTLGWKPTCKCEAGEAIPSIVLDPFCGSGTVLEVAAGLGRKSVGYEISKEYCDLIIDRNRQSILV